jgi:hemolysin activation/secretion protein
MAAVRPWAYASLLMLSADCLGGPGTAWAQTQPPSPGMSAAELNPNSRVSEPPPRSPPGAFAPEPPGPCPLNASDLKVTLSSVAFHGVTVVDSADLSEAYAEFLGKEEPVSVICAIRDRAARMLFDRGVLARVEIPEQRITGGALTLEVIEAHVVNVRVRGDAGPAQDAIERYAEKLRGMAPFDMAKAQRYLLLASDVPGVRVRAAIRPSTSETRGAVDIDLTVAREDPEVFANVQNTGSRQVGRWGGLIRGVFSGYTPYAESTALTAFRTLEANEQWLVQAAETTRFGGEGFAARAALTYGESRPGAALKPLGLKSRSLVGNLEASYPILRTRYRNLNVAGGLDFIDQKTDVGAIRLSHDELRVAYVRADGDYRTEVAGRPVLASGGVSLRKGLSVLGGSEDGDVGLSRAFADPDAWVVRAQAGADVALAERLTGMFRAQAQYSSSALLPYEQMALGGLTIGRGYDPATLLGDKGVSASFELRYGPLQVHRKLLAAPYVFVDAGRLGNNGAFRSGLIKDRTLASAGAGVIFRLHNRANLEVTYAHPMDSAAPGAPTPGDRVLIQLTASLL